MTTPAPTLNDAMFRFFEAELGVSGLANTLNDLMYTYYTNPPGPTTTIDSTKIIDATVIGKALVTAVNAASARATIDAPSVSNAAVADATGSSDAHLRLNELLAILRGSGVIGT